MAPKSFLFGIFIYIPLLFVVAAETDEVDEFFKLVNKSYIVNVEATDFSSPDDIVTISEYHNRDDNNGLLRYQNQKGVTYVFYSSDDKEVLEISNNKCTISPLDKLKNGNMFEEFEGQTYFGPTSVLLQAIKQDFVAIESAKVRGIICSRFQFNGSESVYYIDVPVDFWQTENKAKEGSVPVRLTVLNMTSNSTSYYDYFSFRFPTDWKYKHVPVGIGCKDKKSGNNAKPPNLPRRLSFSAEIFEFTGTKELIKETTKIWYDLDHGAVRFDITYSIIFGSGKTSVREIIDINTGVAYILNSDKCETKAVLDTMAAQFLGKRIDSFKDPNSLIFWYPKDAYYIGKEIVRGIECEIWESYNENFYYIDKQFPKVIFTHYFSTAAELIDEQVETKIPVKVVVNAYRYDGALPEYSVEYNFFDFMEGQAGGRADFSRNFDVSDCFEGPAESNNFAISFTGDFNSTNYTVLRQTLKDGFTSVAKISPMRLASFYVRTTGNKINTFGRLLEEPSALARFNMKEETVIPGQQTMPNGRISLEKCAEACVSENKYKSFVYCTDRCFLWTSDKPDNWGPNVQNKDDVKNCKFYWLPDLDKVHQFTTLQQAVENLKKDSLTISINNISITLETRKFGLLPFDDNLNNGLFMQVLDDMKLIEQSGKTKKLMVNSEKDCYDKCSQEESIECQSFSYCQDKTCVLTSDLIQQNDAKNTAAVSINTFCNVFTRSYINFFDKFEGFTANRKGEKQVNGTLTEESCARECRKETDITCRGFEYCKMKHICVLHKEHVIDFEPIVDNNDQCSHYSLKYTLDYKEHIGKVLVDQNSKLVEGIGVESCAKLCSEDEVDMCKSFSYCPMVKSTLAVCQLNTLTHKEAPLAANSSCSHYYREDDINEIHKQILSKGEQSVSGYSQGGFAGLLVGMIILGAFLGAAGFVLYSFYRTKKGGGEGDDSKVFYQHQRE